MTYNFSRLQFNSEIYKCLSILFSGGTIKMARKEITALISFKKIVPMQLSTSYQKVRKGYIHLINKLGNEVTR